jgi:hypothetical protein
MVSAAEARLIERAKQALHARRPFEMEKTSRYLQAGSPISCFLPSCRKPFLGTCIRAKDCHFYCSRECADEGDEIDLSKIEQLKRA